MRHLLGAQSPFHIPHKIARDGASAVPAKSHKQPMSTRFSTVEEVASVLRVSKMTVYRLVHAAELPAFRIGKQVRIPTMAVWRYLEGQRMLVTDLPLMQMVSYSEPLPADDSEQVG